LICASSFCIAQSLVCTGAASSGITILNAAQHDYPVAMIHLRHATGTLLGPSPSPTVEREVFFHPPAASGGQEK
jgi:hypothetical protein